MALELLRQYFPYLPIAGKYAKAIQKNVDKKKKDNMANIFAEALTDADLSIQTFFEVISLAQNPKVMFAGEEYASSYNDKYFNRNSEYQIFIDPIDGTLPYQENSPRFSIIITILKAGIIEASIIYVPYEELGYYAVRGLGAWVVTDAELVSNQLGKPFKITKQNPYWIDASWNEQIRDKFLKTNLKLLPNIKSADLHHPLITASRLMTGEIYASIRQDAQLIDNTASAFIAMEGGGLMTDFSGNEISLFVAHPGATIPELLWCIDSEIQKQMLDILNK